MQMVLFIYLTELTSLVTCCKTLPCQVTSWGLERPFSWPIDEINVKQVLGPPHQTCNEVMIKVHKYKVSHQLYHYQLTIINSING